MDFRLNKELKIWINKSELFDGGFDVISLAGAGKDLVDGIAEVKDNFIKHINVSVALHSVSKIILFHHSDCGAYAQSYQFNSLDEEKEKQLNDMKKEKEIIQKKFPLVDIVFLWGELKDSKGKNIAFEII